MPILGPNTLVMTLSRRARQHAAAVSSAAVIRRRNANKVDVARDRWNTTSRHRRLTETEKPYTSTKTRDMLELTSHSTEWARR